MKRILRNARTHGQTLVLVAIVVLGLILLGPGYFDEGGQQHFLPWFGVGTVAGLLVGIIASFVRPRDDGDTPRHMQAKQAGGAALAASGSFAILSLGGAWAGGISGFILGACVAVTLFRG